MAADRHSEGSHRCCRLPPNDRLLASTSWDCTTRLWNLDTNLQVGSPLQHETSVPCAAISADGKLLSTSCRQNAYVWDVQAILKATGLEDLLSIPDNLPNVEPKQQPYTSSGLGHKNKSFLEHHSIRQHVEQGRLKLHYVKSKDNTADIFTKALPRKDFERLRTCLGLR